MQHAALHPMGLEILPGLTAGRATQHRATENQGTNQMSDNDAPETLIGDLVVAMLTVNNWPLEKACELRPALERARLFDIEKLSNLSHDEVFHRLKDAGYAKADYVVGLLADRLLAMATTLSGAGFAKLQQLAGSSDQAAKRDRFLLGIKGVGPAVLETFKALRRIGDA